MRILTLNCNGIRSAARKGLFGWLPGTSPDVICLQETRAQEHQLQSDDFRPAGYHCHYFHAERSGYSGVAAFSKARPDRVIRGFGVPEFDREGRYLELQFGPLSVVSLYLPSGSSGPERQASKFRFLDAFLPYMKRLDAAPARLRAVRRLQHRTPADRPEELACEPEKFRLPAGGTRLARPRVRRRSAGWMHFARLTPGPSSTPGGRIAARRGRKMSDGGSTTRSGARRSRARHARPRSTGTRGFPITLR